ncbi:disintegrin and metalloproteinase domain-containing protein 10-like, partial [Ruditapes philippinarum]|uniref:disintegrin and metalloproteinase domain-containing protein 10-like n=1 Tax=Ruditapes philippinarum TaxID=129788 RepID=UPI00295B124A
MDNYFRFFIWTVLQMACGLSVSANNELLDKRLLYYEPLHYDIDDLHLRHTQVGKSGDLLRVNFYAFNKNFSLELRRKDKIDHQASILHHKKEITTPDLSFVYTGKRY